MKFIIGKKLGMTQVFKEDGTVVPVTRVQAGPCVITQVKNAEKDGVNSVQVGFDSQKQFRLNKSEQGHLKGLWSVRMMKDFKTTSEDKDLKRGDTFSVKMFTNGEKIQVTGHSKGRGFQGVVKRHGFHGGPKTHGHKDNLRAPGSIGAGGVQRVFKNMRMGGHMGTEQITIKNLEIVEVLADTNELLIKGAVPGARNGYLFILSDSGKIQVDVAPTSNTEETSEKVDIKNEEIPADTTPSVNTTV